MSYRPVLPHVTAQVDPGFKTLVDEKRVPHDFGLTRYPRSAEASSLTDCERKLWYRWHGVPPERPNDFSANRGAVGKAVEYQILRWLALAGILRNEQVYLYDPMLELSGIIDAVVEPEPGTFNPLEIKSVDVEGTKSGYRTKREPKEDAYVQLQAYLLMTDTEAGYLIYYDIGKLADWWAFRVPRSDEATTWIGQRCSDLSRMMPLPTPPPRPGAITSPSEYWRCGFCPYAGRCFGEDR